MALHRVDWRRRPLPPPNPAGHSGSG